MQTWDPQRYAANARFVSDLGAAVVDLLDPQRGERILDLGCGDGALTVELVRRGAEVIGVDGSDAMVAAARERGVDARVMDGQSLTFDSEFDAVFSNAALHWMTRADDVIAGVARALKPGGRFVGEMGGHGCVAAITTALLGSLKMRGVDGENPWYFPTPDDYTSRLERHGFIVKEMLHFPRPTPLPGDIRTWLDTFAHPFLDRIDPSEHEAVKDDAADLLRPSLCDERGRWTVDYVRLRFSTELRT